MVAVECFIGTVCLVIKNMGDTLLEQRINIILLVNLKKSITNIYKILQQIYARRSNEKNTGLVQAKREDLAIWQLQEVIQIRKSDWNGETWSSAFRITGHE